MAVYSPRDVAFSKILYMVPADDGDTVNAGTLAGGSLDGVNTEGEGGVLTVSVQSGGADPGASNRVAGTYEVSPTGGSGTGLVVSVFVDSDRVVAAADVTIINGGKDYADTDTDLLIVSTALGGSTAGTGDLTLGAATVATAANSTGVSNTKRHFIPVNAGLTAEADGDAANDSSGTPSPSRGDGIDYGNSAENLAAQREECQKLIGQNRDSDDTGSVADEQIGFTVFGVQ